MNHAANHRESLLAHTLSLLLLVAVLALAALVTVELFLPELRVLLRALTP